MKSRWSILLAVMTAPLVSMDPKEDSSTPSYIITKPSCILSGIGECTQANESCLFRILGVNDSKYYVVGIRNLENKNLSYGTLEKNEKEGMAINAAPPSMELPQPGTTNLEDNPAHHVYFTQEMRTNLELYLDKEITWNGLSTDRPTEFNCQQ